MYELHQVGEGTYYIASPANIGLYVDAAGDATLIDSGNDQEAGRKILQHLKANGWALKRILNTHSNADHTGGNAFLQQRTGCEIYSTPIENAFTEHPLLEPSFLYGGFPPKALRNKFLMPRESITHGDIWEHIPEGFQAISLPGHYFGMVGFRTPDDVLFLADCLFSDRILNKYHISFLYDVEQHLSTITMVEGLTAKLFIPSHGEPTEDIRPLCAANRDKAQEIIALLSVLCITPRTAEELITAAFDHFNLTMDFNQYVLVGSTIRSYISYLLDHNGLEAIFEENRLKWKSL